MKTSVRLALVEGATSVLLNHVEYKEPILEELEKRTRDAEEAVRVKAVAMAGMLARRGLAYVDLPLLEAVQSRIHDRKVRLPLFP